MNTTLWILAAVLAAAFMLGGLAQILLPKERYRAIGATQHWVDDFEPGHLKAIGTIKILGSVGLIVPAALGIASVLTPVAACCLALVMAGAATTRFRRCEWAYLIGDVLFLSLFALLAWGRFDLRPF